MSTRGGDQPPAGPFVGTQAGPSAPEPEGAARPLGLPKPAGPSTAPALARLNEMVVAALGAAQRDWVRGLQLHRSEAAGDGSLASRISERLDHVECRRQRNIEAILQRALRLLPEDVAEGIPDQDWAAAFFTHAADTADPEFARLWARLLVQEVRRPGAVPCGVLVRLPGLSKTILAIFRRLSAFAVNNFVVRLEPSFFEGKDVTSDDMLLLEEYGLIRTNRDLNRVFQSQREDRFSTNLLYADKALRITHAQPGKQLVLSCIRLTEFGTTLCRALLEEGELRSDTDYIVEVVRLLQRQGFQTAQADILERADEQVVSRHSPFCDIVALGR
ncbi:DUF2806 domain-containing protein [Thalassobaculum sp. OXR-137]|uniref:DUF2806 domain-containing protein n=1 Tax=Thalassobaculum sp. OXR-137 TaxID=3100173 RepID=UPI002AC96440|nr:DUF2806 domain-containing protein [Thalassobaculum sp. OXR-137]WPZ32276.1 DUF2806 domain-containing protein [Thalassobaculum sp. OXR-137]